MISINIPSDYEIKLEQIAQNENITISEVVEKAIQIYFSHYFEQATPYTLGKDLFGKYGS